MSLVNYTLISDERGKSLTVYIDKGDDFVTHVLASTSATFDTLLNYLLTTDEANYDVDYIESQADVLRAVGTKLAAVSERIRVTDSALLFDGDELKNTLSDHIVRMVREGEEYTPLVAFLEKIQTNPSPDSVESLYSWLADREFTITQDGDFIAYKGVKVDKDGLSRSILTGKAIVNGVVHDGNIPNPDGAVVEMPRSEVQANSAVGCAPGLHAGTWKYASDFSQGRVLVVKINPRDVVSVPSDCNFQKLRTSRYVVISTVESEYKTTTYRTANVVDVEVDYDEDDDPWGEDDNDDEGYF